MSDLIFETNLGEPYAIKLENEENNTFTIRAELCDVDVEIGTVKFRVFNEVCELLNIQTKEFYRGQGVGHVLLCQAEGIAQMLGAKMILADVLPIGVNTKFINTYFRKHHYEKISEKDTVVKKDLTKYPPTTLSRI